MQLLKNKKAWNTWKSSEMSDQGGVLEPRKYPCYAYTSVRSFGYEEYAEHYLYLEEVETMYLKLSSHAKHKITKEQEECTHPEEECRSRWNYSGDEIKSASGFCKRCGINFGLNRDTGELEILGV